MASLITTISLALITTLLSPPSSASLLRLPSASIPLPLPLPHNLTTSPHLKPKPWPPTPFGFDLPSNPPIKLKLAIYNYAPPPIPPTPRKIESSLLNLWTAELDAGPLAAVEELHKYIFEELEITFRAYSDERLATRGLLLDVLYTIYKWFLVHGPMCVQAYVLDESEGGGGDGVGGNEGRDLVAVFRLYF